MQILSKLKIKAARLRRHVTTLYWVARYPRTPWYARLFIAAVVAYALSPVDLIPDAVPILGYADDFLAISLAIWLASRLVPADVMQECRDKTLCLSIPSREVADWREF